MSDIHDPLRANGSLTYLELIDLITVMWESAHPDVPVFPTQSSNFATYPCISYGLEYRKTMANESKKKIRHQMMDPQYNNIIVSAQRFENYITFAVHTENDPRLAEEIIESFEEFIDRYVGVFKQLGVSEFLYARRFSDREINEDSQDTCVRMVGYLVTLEKLTVTDYERIEKVTIDARLYIEHNRAETPSTEDNIEIILTDTYADATPIF